MGVCQSVSNPFPKPPPPPPTEKGGDARVHFVLMCADSCSLDARLLCQDEHGEIIQQTIIRRLFDDISVIVPRLRAGQGDGEGKKDNSDDNKKKHQQHRLHLH